MATGIYLLPAVPDGSAIDNVADITKQGYRRDSLDKSSYKLAKCKNVDNDAAL